MRIDLEPIPNYEKIQMVFLGIIVAAGLTGYGLCALVQGACALISRGNPPIGMLVTFYGLEARLLSLIYIGGGIWLFAGSFLDKCRNMAKETKALSWLGAITLFVGMCSLVVILSLPLFQA